MNSTPALLELQHVSKAFPGVRALAGVDFSLRRGEIHALMGENGAGKSTLIKTLTGVYRRDEGHILVDGAPVDFYAPFEAPLAGISTVYQEVNLIPTLSVAENLSLGREPQSWTGIDWRSVRNRARTALGRLDLDLEVDLPLSAYSIAIQQMVAIARAVDVEAKVLVLDEPTSSLDAQESERLFVIMRKLRDQGLGILFVTHFLDQVYEISDRITVLRNGALVGTWATSELPKVDLVAKMMGKELQGLDDKVVEAAGTGKKTLLRTWGLGRRGALHPLDLELKQGEVLGLAGLLGSGRTETAETIYGIAAADQGCVEVDGAKRILRNPRESLRLGFGFCPEDRKVSGIIDELSVRENVVLALQAKQGIFRRLGKKAQQDLADQFIASLGIVTPNAEQKVKNLSGGNQQKVILARWLAAEPRLLVLDEPTRGIDVGARTEIQRTILKLAEGGMSILFISAELSEVVRCCTRVAVLRDRHKLGELHGAEITESALMATIAQG